MSLLDRSTWRAGAAAIIATVLVTSALGASSLQAASIPAVGLWRTIDDKTREPKSIVETFIRDGKLCGRVKQLLAPSQASSSREANPRCTACNGPQKDAPIEGLEIMWDLGQNGDSWDKGSVLDPASGTIYRCRVRNTGPDKLEVRGFVGIALFGRTQVWERAPAPASPPAPTRPGTGP